ncbi:hypothetical protein WR25_03715 [Diploscapter pachys]|uniref:Thioredoxin domain-containing protein n=1 Tax=Diploscapter pachys TaxID=2018661 RepID=A0A2A2LP63_9BILA|nr:hypothetical protein WR25_03715 [Diploscapter pachys]
MRLVASLLLLNFVAAKKEKKTEPLKEESKKDLSHGFLTDIDWVSFDKAVGIAKDLNKPVFFLIHKSWCGACKGKLVELSKKFVMVNVQDDEEPEENKYAPDGGYIPRILFLDTNGNLLKTNNEKKYKNHKFFYPLIPQVINGMERALDEFGGEEASTEDKPKKDEKKKSTEKSDKDQKKSKKDEDKSDDKKKKDKKETKSKAAKEESKAEKTETKEKKPKDEAKSDKKREKSPEKKEKEKKSDKKSKGDKDKEAKEPAKKEDKKDKKSGGKKDKKSKDEL